MASSPTNTNTPTDMNTDMTASNVTISTSQLDIGHGLHTVAHDINMQMHSGELLVLIGTNGSGKSTLLKTLAGMIAPIRGDHAGQSLEQR